MNINWSTAQSWTWFNGHTYIVGGSPRVSNSPGLGWQDANLNAQYVDSVIAIYGSAYLAKIDNASENQVVYQLAYDHVFSWNSAYVAPDGGNGIYVWLGGNNIVRAQNIKSFARRSNYSKKGNLRN